MPDNKLDNFDPNTAGNHQNTIFGLPFGEKDAQLVIIPIPWDATVSYRDGTALGPMIVQESSYQVDLYDPEFVDRWKQGIYLCEIPEFIHQKSIQVRELVEPIIEKQESGLSLGSHDEDALLKINKASQELNEWVASETQKYVQRGQYTAVLGGDHSTTLGHMKALAAFHPDMSVLQIDAHMDLRKAYEGFIYSHASVMYNMRQEVPSIQKLVQVGLRDFCDEEITFAAQDEHIHSFYDQDLKNKLFQGRTYDSLCTEIITLLTDEVYISVDIDGLYPQLCPHTGTPVAGGFQIEELYYLIKKIVDSGRKIIGFDLVEVAGDIDNTSIDSIVGARLLYKLSNYLLASHG